MEQLQRVGISLDEVLLARFDKAIEAKGYMSRSEAIRDLIRESLTSEQLAQPDTEAIAAVFVVYDHHQAQLPKKLMKLQHNEFLKTISSLHIHLDHHDCLEIILLKGKVKEITKLGDSIISLKGVKLGKVNLIASND